VISGRLGVRGINPIISARSGLYPGNKGINPAKSDGKVL
jgi:hypothetical protein